MRPSPPLLLAACVAVLAVTACVLPSEDSGDTDKSVADTEDQAASDADEDNTGEDDTDADDTDVVVDETADTGDAATPPDPFGDGVSEFNPGSDAGFGADALPDIVLGPPQGAGEFGGSLDVVSLGTGGSIVIEFTDWIVIDGPGPDLIVFENAFNGFPETGYVAASEDGSVWHEWPCDPFDMAGGYPGCAGVNPVLTNPSNGIDPTDPDAAGGDAFDLADLPLSTARFVRITDTGQNWTGGGTAGFDLDAIVVVNGASP